MPNTMFMKCNPIVCGVVVVEAGVDIEAGVIKMGTPICIPSKDFIYEGVVTSLQFNNEMDTARMGEELCVKIAFVPGEAPRCSAGILMRRTSS